MFDVANVNVVNDTNGICSKLGLGKAEDKSRIAAALIVRRGMHELGQQIGDIGPSIAALNTSVARMASTGEMGLESVKLVADETLLALKAAREERESMIEDDRTKRPAFGSDGEEDGG